MPSLLLHDLCHGRSSSRWLPAVAHQAPLSMAGKNTGVDRHALLQGIFPTQGSNPRLLLLLHWQAYSFYHCTTCRPLVLFTVRCKFQSFRVSLLLLEADCVPDSTGQGPSRPQVIISCFPFCSPLVKIIRTSSVMLGEGNGTPLQYSCLETPMDGRAW